MVKLNKGVHITKKGVVKRNPPKGRIVKKGEFDVWLFEGQLENSLDFFKEAKANNEQVFDDILGGNAYSLQKIFPNGKIGKVTKKEAEEFLGEDEMIEIKTEQEIYDNWEGMGVY